MTYSGNGHSEIKISAYAESGHAYARTAGDWRQERQCWRAVVLEVEVLSAGYYRNEE